jgi:hypothetical protein
VWQDEVVQRSGHERLLVVSGPLHHQRGVFRALLGLLPPPVGPWQILMVGEVQSHHRCGDDAPEDLAAPEDCARLAARGIMDSAYSKAGEAQYCPSLQSCILHSCGRDVSRFVSSGAPVWSCGWHLGRGSFGSQSCGCWSGSCTEWLFFFGLVLGL